MKRIAGIAKRWSNLKHHRDQKVLLISTSLYRYKNITSIAEYYICTTLENANAQETVLVFIKEGKIAKCLAGSRRILNDTEVESAV